LHAGTATTLYGLYYTGLDSNGSLQSGGSLDANWNVTYASTNGGSSQNSTYKGDAYVVDPDFVTSVAWVQNTAHAQWITAPGALDNSNSTYNSGGSYLPGNGTASGYGNEGIYIYTLAFTIAGTGTGTVTNHVSISLTIAADDQAKIYINPSGNGTTLPTATAAATIGAGAWDNTESITLANYTDNAAGITNNSTFKIGTNYLVVAVYNTNAISGYSSSTSWNASGFMMYQVGSVAVINGVPVPEIAPWMPVAAALALYGALLLYRRYRQASHRQASC
jgi:hypothetical protein